jgi:hypothetical protein
MKYLLDSNIIIYHLNGEDIATKFISENRDVCTISRITFIEVLSFNLSPEEEYDIKELLESFIIIDTNKEIAIQSIKNIKAVKIKVPDNIIASTAQVHNMTLVTRNTADFNSLDIKILNIFEG